MRSQTTMNLRNLITCDSSVSFHTLDKTSSTHFFPNDFLENQMRAKIVDKYYTTMFLLVQPCAFSLLLLNRVHARLRDGLRRDCCKECART